MNDSVGEIGFELKLDTEGLKASINQTGDSVKKELAGSFHDAGKQCEDVCNSVRHLVNQVGSDIGAELEGPRKKIQEILSDVDLSAKTKATKIAWIYRKEGMSASDAMKKAWTEIEREGAKSTQKTTKHVKKLNQQLENTEDLAGNVTQSMSSGFESLSGTIKKIGRIFASAFAIHELEQFVSECLDLGSDLAEVQNVVDVTFEKMAKDVNIFSKEAAMSFGLSETMAKRYAGTFGAMAQSFGFTEQAAYEMSTTLTGLAGDIASFYNISQDEAYTKLKSVFTGETESLKELGVVMTQTALDAYALENGFGKTTSAMSEMEKVSLRYSFIQSKLTKASGDFARTSDGWANQVRILKLQTESIKADLGQGFINAFSPGLKMLNMMLSKLSVFASEFKELTAYIMGQKTTGIDQIASSAEQAAAGVSGITEAAEEAKKALNALGIDELNIVGDYSADTASDISSITGITTTPDSAVTDEAIENSPLIRWFDRVIEESEPTRDALKTLYQESIKPMMDCKLDNLVQFHDKFLVPVGEWTLGEGIPGLANALNNLVKDVDWDGLSRAAGELFDAFAILTKGFGEGFIEGIDSITKIAGSGLAFFINGVTGALDEMSELDPDLLESIGQAIGIVASGLVGIKIVTGLAGWIKGLGVAFGAFATSQAGGVALLATLAAALVSLGKYADAKFMEAYKEGVQNAVQGVEDAINGYDADMSRVNYDYERIKSLLDDYYELSQKDYNFLGDEDKQKLKEYYDALVEYCPEISGQIDEITGAYKGTREELQKLIDKQYDMYAMSATESALKELMEQSVELGYELFDTNQKFEDTKSKLIALMEEGKKYGQWTQEDIKKLKELTLDDVIQDFDVLNDVLEENSGVWVALLQDILPESDENFRKLKKALEEYGEGAIQLKEAQDKLNDKVDYAKDSLQKLSERFLENGNQVMEYSGKVTDAGDTVRKGMDKIKSAATDTNGVFKTAMDGMKDALSGLQSSAETKTSQIRSLVSGMASSVSASVSSAVSSLSELVKSAVASIDAELNVSGSASVTTNKNSLLSSFPVPKLAGGGYVRANTPQLAMIGDNRHQGEVVAPEDKLLEMAKMAAEMAGGNGDAKMYSYMETMVGTMQKLIDTVGNLSLSSEVSGRNLRMLVVNEEKRAGYHMG